MRALLFLTVLTGPAIAGALACAPSVGGDAAGASEPPPALDDSTSRDASVSATAAAPSDGAAPADAGSSATYRNSLSVCWTDAKCPRAMVVAHGGDWSPTTVPYGSMAAVVAAYDHGVEGVKIDVRVTKDGVPVIAHSSPVEIYESLDCYGKRIEELTAAQVSSCHFVQKTSETFQRLDTMLGYARGKMVLQLTVKEPRDYARAITEVIALGAQDFAFFEVSTSDLQVVGAEPVYFLVNVGNSLEEIDLLLGASKNPRAFMVEMDSSAQTSAIIAAKLHPANVRAFTYDSSATPSVGQHFARGFDVVSSNATATATAARIAVNKSKGVAPP